MNSPVDITEEELRAAAEGRSEEVLATRSQPIELSETEVKQASEGKLEQVIQKRSSKGAKTTKSS